MPKKETNMKFNIKCTSQLERREVGHCFAIRFMNCFCALLLFECEALVGFDYLVISIITNFLVARL